MSIDMADSAGPLAGLFQRSEPAQASEPAQSSDSIQPSEFAQPSDSIQPSESLQNAERAESEAVQESSEGFQVGRRRLVPRSVGWILTVLGVLTLPWIAGLALELPSKAESAHYDVSWAGFDVLLCLLLLRTGWSALHDLEHVEITAAMTGALLIVDAWFDVMSASDSDQFLAALGMAVCVELPLAGLCLWIAGRVDFERRRRSEVLTTLVRRFEARYNRKPGSSELRMRTRRTTPKSGR